MRIFYIFIDKFQTPKAFIRIGIMGMSSPNSCQDMNLNFKKKKKKRNLKNEVACISNVFMCYCIVIVCYLLVTFSEFADS